MRIMLLAVTVALTSPLLTLITHRYPEKLPHAYAKDLESQIRLLTMNLAP